MKYKLVVCAALCLCLSACGEDTGGEKTGENSPAVCGNGALDDGEACDDGNADAGDGCAADCAEIEAGFECKTPGEPCTRQRIL